jgi:hypothetical protein
MSATAGISGRDGGLMRAICAVTVAAAMLSIGTPASGQRAGVFVGVSATSAKVEASGSDWDRVGMLTAGGFLEVGSGWLRLRPELVLLRRGGDQEDRRASVRMTHLQLPVLIAVVPNTGSRGIQPIAYLGPALGVKLDCTAGLVSVEGDEIVSSCADAGWSLRGLEAGGIIGGGLRVPVGTATLVLEARHVRAWNAAPPRGLEQQVSSHASSLTTGVAFRVR